MSERIKVVSLKMTTYGCPTQWEGRTDDDRPVYVRFRWSHGRVFVGEVGQDVDRINPLGTPTVEWGERNDPNGCLSFDELKTAVPSIDWPEQETPE